jgi:hypothetical protein
VPDEQEVPDFLERSGLGELGRVVTAVDQASGLAVDEGELGCRHHYIVEAGYTIRVFHGSTLLSGEPQRDNQ